MLRPPHHTVWVFDAEWVPDPPTGRRVLGLPQDMPDAEVLQALWNYGGATEAEPRPYLKTVLCRLVSLSAVVRTMKGGEVQLRLMALPEKAEAMAEDELLRRFLVALGDRKPQLVGFNSREADLPILVQRALVHGLSIPGLGRSQDRWDKVDFFDRYGAQHIDLREALGGWGKASATLHELATACGIPGKLGTDGRSVIDLWLAGDIAHIVRYNAWDALTTYLVWLRAQCLAGHLTPQQRDTEEAQLRRLLSEKIAVDPAFQTYLAAWDQLRQNLGT